MIRYTTFTYKGNFYFLQTFLPSLEDLIAHHNNITLLDKDFHGLPSLCFADLSHNRIQSMNYEVVSKSRCTINGVPSILKINLQGWWSPSLLLANCSLFHILNHDLVIRNFFACCINFAAFLRMSFYILWIANANLSENHHIIISGYFLIYLLLWLLFFLSLLPNKCINLLQWHLILIPTWFHF